MCLIGSPLQAAAPTVPGFDSYEDAAKWMGCPEVEVQVSDSAIINAHFYPKGIQMTMIGPILFETNYIVLTQGLVNLKPELTMQVLLHEAAHCVQTSNGWDHYILSTDREQEADVMSVNAMCALGYDGVALEEELAHVAAAANGMDLDEENSSHGSLRERLTHVAKAATVCRERAIEGF